MQHTSIFEDVSVVALKANTQLFTKQLYVVVFWKIMCFLNICVSLTLGATIRFSV